MHPQKTQSARSRLKFNVRQIPLSTGKIVVLILLPGAIITGVLLVMTGSAIYGSLSVLITSVATVLAIYPRPEAKTPTDNAVPASANNTQRGRVTQNAGEATGEAIFFFNMPLCDANEFYGHSAARTTLIARTANGGSSSIVGERRAGKTWLLGYLRLVAATHSKLGAAYRVASISAEHPRCKSLAGVVEWVLEELGMAQVSGDLGLSPLERLSQGVRALKKLGIRAVLCIDEFEGFDNRQEFNAEFVEGLRAMAQNDGLVLVTASKRSLKELIEDLTGGTSPLFNIVQQIALHPFTEQEAREFVRDKGGMAGFTKGESDFFFEQSTLHTPYGEPYWPPLRLQLVGQMLLDDKQAAQGEPLDDKLDKFRYRSEFETRLSETYQAVVR